MFIFCVIGTVGSRLYTVLRLSILCVVLSVVEKTSVRPSSNFTPISILAEGTAFCDESEMQRTLLALGQGHKHLLQENLSADFDTIFLQFHCCIQYIRNDSSPFRSTAMFCILDELGGTLIPNVCWCTGYCEARRTTGCFQPSLTKHWTQEVLPLEASLQAGVSSSEFPYSGWKDARWLHMCWHGGPYFEFKMIRWCWSEIKSPVVAKDREG